METQKNKEREINPKSLETKKKEKEKKKEKSKTSTIYLCHKKRRKREKRNIPQRKQPQNAKTQRKSQGGTDRRRRSTEQ